jgi:hypothetical protein
MVSDLKIFAVAVACVAGLTALAGELPSSKAPIAVVIANSLFIWSPLFWHLTLHAADIVSDALTRSAYGFAQGHG